MNIMSNLPNDIIINILKERRIMKQTDRYKKNYNFVIKEIIKFDKQVFRNLVKYFYEKHRDTGKILLKANENYKRGLKHKKIYLMDEIKEIFNSVYFLNDNTITPKLILDHIEYLAVGEYYS